MQIIPELISDDAVAWIHDAIWCRCQGWWEDPAAKYLTEGGPTGILICCAHMNETRVYLCPYSGPGQCEFLGNCADYEPNNER
jgi:hypothetical protein